MTFKELDLRADLLEALSYMNFTDATEIQEKAIPEILNNKDLIGCAQTGTGKTAAFVLPALHKIMEASHPGKTHSLIITPTRELAIQIEQLIEGLSYFTNANCFAIYGGSDGISWEAERRALEHGSSIIVATPGRLLSHLSNGYADFSFVKQLILDEADRMLDIGFHDDIMKIIEYLPKERQNIMFSATMAPKIRTLAKTLLHNPTEINLSVSKPAAGVTQRAILVKDENKNALVKSLLNEFPDYQSIIIFCSTKRKVEQLSRVLANSKFNVKPISSDYEQDHRQQVLLDFKSRRTRIVVATDVLSRGIDVKDINLVINYDVPGDAEDYVHRIGRTARASTKGLAITLINSEDMYKFSKIEALIEKQFDKENIPEKMGVSPEWSVETRSKKKRKPSNKKFYRKPKS